MQAMSNCELIFGVDATRFIEPIDEIVNGLYPVQYTFIDDDKFRSLLQSEFNEAHAQYWREILYRAHFTAATSIIRNYQWIRGMHSAYEGENFLNFCSAFRSLIESSADSFEALNNVFMTLAKHSKPIRRALNKSATEFSTCKELEDQLIHFSHARRTEKGEMAPDSHKAKSAATYVKILDTVTKESFYDCYSNLCQYTHPAAHSVGHMMISITASEWMFVPGHEKEKIQEYAKEYQSLILPLFTACFTPSMLCLKVLRALPESRCHVNRIDKIDFSEIKAWRMCESYLRDL